MLTENRTMRKPHHIIKMIIIFVFALFEANTSAFANIKFDESATYKYMSHQALVYWPTKSFDHFTALPSHRLIGEHLILDKDKARAVLINLSDLLLEDKITLLIKSAPKDKGVVTFYSKEFNELTTPLLIFKNVQDDIAYPATIDTSFTNTVIKPLGQQNIFTAGRENISLLQFTLSDDKGSYYDNAKLYLSLTNKQFGDAKLQIYQLLYNSKQVVERHANIAASYPNDLNIIKDPSVYYADDFDTQNFSDIWLEKLGMKKIVWQNSLKLNYIDHNEIEHYFKNNKVKKDGKALVASFKKNEHLALNLDYYFKTHHGIEPDEAYFRYYLMLSPDASVSGGGKLPGFSGTYNRAGWGGRPNNGSNGWSARGAFFETVADKNSFYNARMPIGNYVYEAKNDQKYGKTISWGNDLSAIEKGRWYAIEQHIKLNTPGTNDGLLEVWIDGVKIFKKNDLYFRDTPSLKIEKVWFNFYFGGTERPKYDFDMYVDNIVIASKYIGPIKK